MEAIWETHEAPAPLTLFAIPDEAAQTNHAQIDVPWLFGLMGTRSLSTEIPGIKELTPRPSSASSTARRPSAYLNSSARIPPTNSSANSSSPCATTSASVFS